jgi:hypothetical protein
MGVQDREYMRNRGASAPQAGGAADRRDSTHHRPYAAGPAWLKHLAFWVIAALLVFVAFKYFMEQRGNVPFPRTGDVFWYSVETRPRIALLTLHAPADTTRNFAVRLDDWSTKAPIALIPVRAGETSKTLMPLGRYRMTISKGSGWMGSSHLFGMSGESREVLDPIEFYQRGNRTFGVQIDLEVPFQGNLETRPSFER